jgi:hypothetical protein
MKKAVLFIFLGIIGLWVVGIVLVNFFNVDLDKYFNPSESAQQASSPGNDMGGAANNASGNAPSGGAVASDWKTYKNDDFHFSIQFPVDITEIKMPSTPAMKMVSLTGIGADKKFILNGSLMQMSVALPDSLKNLDTEIKVLKQMDKIMTGLDVNSSPATFSGIAGLEAVGTYQMMGKDNWGLRIFKAQKGKAVMNVMLQFPNTDENKATADKILRSLSWSD